MVKIILTFLIALFIQHNIDVFAIMGTSCPSVKGATRMSAVVVGEDNSLVLLYKFEEQTGTVVYDSAPATASNGTNSGATIGQTGKINKCYLFDGSNDYVYADIVGFNTTSGTFCMWVKPTSVGDEKIFFSYGASDATIFVEVRDYPANYHLWSAYRVGGNDHGVDCGVFSDTINFHHVTYTWNTVTDKFITYIDAVEAGRDEVAAASITGQGTTVNIGRLIWTGGNNYPSYNDEFRIYNRDLPLSEIQAIYNGTQ